MNNKFSENLKKIRKEHNLSQEQLAEELCVSRQAISKWESGQAYPEMDKIIFLCDKFNLNIDDLLHRDIKEAKGEEEVKKKWNIYVEQFFKYTTDSINLFCKMKFWGKVKCLFEQCMIALALYIFFSICYGFFYKITDGLLNVLFPFSIFDKIGTYLSSIYSLATFILSLIIMFRVFKLRYLDYYEEEKKETDNSKELKDKKLDLKKDDKIIIRDKKDSDYSIFKMIGKIIIIGLKIAALWIAFNLCIGLVFIGIGVVLSFLVAKSGLFFFGCLLALLSAAVMDIVVILLFFNFIFNRKNSKKPMIWSFIISVITVGMGIGMIFIGSLDFKMVDDKQDYITDSQEINMNEKTFFNRDDIEYIIEDRSNLKVEYEILDNRVFYINENSEGMIHINVYNDDELKEIKHYLKGFDKKQIINRNVDINKIRVYASQENISKLENNKNTYYEETKKHDDEVERLENEIEEKNNYINELEEKLLDKE